ncbi:MAG: hypothetical protein IJW73_04425 [Candidatus Gastranaerophilales bacterium]|nr:hypothetical protein [Candidatus Gastranaerophilales bacterium]
MIMLFTVIAKKAKAVAEKTSGVFYCFKDPEGRLNQRVELSDGTIQELTNINSCNFSFPNEATDFITYVIGGGGGGGKISDTYKGYDLTTTKNHEFILFKPTSGMCALYPTISIDGIKSSLTASQYMCDEEIYTCTQGNIDILATNDDPTVKKIFNNSAYTLAVLTNRTLFIKGGNNGSGGPGALCTFKIDIPYGETIEYYFDGRDEYICSAGVEKKLISASSGKFKTSKIEITAQGKSFDNESYRNEHVAPTADCTSSSSTIINKKYTTLNRQNDKIEYVIVSPVVEYGTGGKAGNYITNTNIKFSGKNIIIPKNNIGNGGKAGEDGEPTIFEEYNIKAQGGSAGTTQTTTYELSIDSVDSGLLIKGEDLILEGASQYIFSPNRMQTKFIDNADNNGALSEYASEKVIPGVVVSKQQEYMGIGSKCTANGCSEAIPAKNESFGTGGGGGNTKVTYDPYYKFIYTRPNYLLNENEYTINSIITPKTEIKNGSAGMGGAIVITWK